MKPTIYYIIIILAILSGITDSYSQTGKKHIREGNKHYEKSEFDNSEVSYRKALEEEQSSFKALFNLGDALYKQEKFEDAAGEFNTTSQIGNDKISRARSFHNLGNSFLKASKLEESIQAYKNALRNNPGDLETKYNLAHAQDLLKQQQQQQEQQDKQQGEDNSEEKEQEQKENNDQEDRQKDQQNKDQEQEEKQKEEQQKQQPQPQQMSKEDAERLLEALAIDEKELQEKLKKAEARKKKVVVKKNW